MIEASNRIRNDAHPTRLQYLPNSSEATDRIREMHKKGADKGHVIAGTDLRLGNLRRVGPDRFNPGSQQRMADEEVQATHTLAHRRLEAPDVLGARRWKIHGGDMGRTHPLKQEAEEPARPTDVEHPLSGNVWKPVRRQYWTMIVMSVDHDTVADVYGVIEADFSAECRQV